ncbi:MAG: SDR family NAD(P)-dependent oxidoreductase, partial [Chloroflexi bacterium]|nr:SDR family NAD(P)-dependent oxidoreductase [Chloroflexota bacterium]
MNSLNLDGVAVIITGGGSGLGKEMALALGKAGADVIVAHALARVALRSVREAFKPAAVFERDRNLHAHLVEAERLDL